MKAGMVGQESKYFTSFLKSNLIFRLTTRVKQMLNEQKAHHRSGYQVFGSQGMSPLSSQGISAAPQRHSSVSQKGQSSRRQSTSHSATQRRLKRASIVDEDEEMGSRNGEEMMEDEEFGSESAEQVLVNF
jgi:uncharacterized protein with von Willebrand factor type A (vWA) domain